jgi:hypothetical protein
MNKSVDKNAYLGRGRDTPQTYGIMIINPLTKLLIILKVHYLQHQVDIRYLNTPNLSVDTPIFDYLCLP